MKGQFSGRWRGLAGFYAMLLLFLSPFAAVVADVKLGNTACRHYGSGQAKFLWATPNPNLHITLTAGPCGLFSRISEGWWRYGWEWRDPLGYFSQENAQKRQQLWMQKEVFDARYHAAKAAEKLRGVKPYLQSECCSITRETCEAVVLGVEQGSANTVNGLQDAVIGVVNLSPSLCSLAASPFTDFRFGEIPSPDWSTGWTMEEDQWMHSGGKFVGGEGLLALITYGASGYLQGAGCAQKGLMAADKAEDVSKAAKAADKADDVARGADKLDDAARIVKPKGGTYKLTDPKTGKVIRTGRTENLNRRMLEHRRNPATKDLDFIIDKRTDREAGSNYCMTIISRL